MKSAYELAMEKLEQDGPSVKLTEDQKAEIGKVDDKFRAKIAEKELFLDDLIAKAASVGNYGELGELETQKTREISRLREECEEAKESVRKANSG